MRTVFFDVDTQLDFLFPAGALYVPGAELRLPAIVALNRYAAAQGFPLVSTVDAHAENDPEFRIWPHHCVAGTAGQAKAADTLLEKRAVVSTRPGGVEAAGAPQVIVEKQQLDPFTNPNLPALLETLGAGRYVLYGLVTEYCVGWAARGLLATGKPVTLVADAVESLSAEASERTLREFQEGGGRLATVGQILGGE
jgi:nicotinamidase/pyrazinamidase